MRRGFLNFVERLANGRLYHCRFCRVQFYDRRDFVPVREEMAAETPLTEQTPQQTG